VILENTVFQVHIIVELRSYLKAVPEADDGLSTYTRFPTLSLPFAELTSASDDTSSVV